jgi:hypothetical protein
MIWLTIILSFSVAAPVAIIVGDGVAAGAFVALGCVLLFSGDV